MATTRTPATTPYSAQADHEPDAVRRGKILRQAEQIMLDDEGMAPIGHSVSRSLVNPRVTGWVDNPLNVHRARWLCMKPGAGR